MGADFFEDTYSIFFLIGILMLPNVLLQCIQQWRGRNPAPYWAFFFSILMNVGYGIAIYSPEIGIPIAAFGLFFVLIPFDLCCRTNSFQSPHRTTEDIFSKKLNRTEFCSKVSQSRAYSPSITVHSEAYHIRHYTTTTVDSKGRVHVHHHTQKVVTFRNARELKYTSWEEEGNSIRITNNTTMFHAIIIPSYKLDDDTKESLGNLREYMRYEALQHDVHASVSTSFSIDGLERSFCGSATQDSVPIMNFYQSWYGRTLWVFFALLGYQSAYESFYSASGERLQLTVVKRISMTDKLRCHYKELDQTAAETTFRAADGVQTFQQPLFVPMAQPFQQIENPYVMAGYAPENPYQEQLTPELQKFAQEQNIQTNDYYQN
ncbi:hypothetical protein GPJ56_009419 [Histomonas meleagridis]|uniref:uncharacterized protein n=1 Tax=Histomonas meleagridis TaxID=135588 RepID=UPI00355A187B|nr:hypothetical protein GPJ56_009419 [Histomonas meleagridis]KAH0797477.1 hypothetical protein GO595_009798 [Histomonas meleagridis]